MPTKVKYQFYKVFTEEATFNIDDKPKIEAHVRKQIEDRNHPDEDKNYILKSIEFINDDKVKFDESD